MIKSFRGLIVDGGQDTIVLHTNDGSVGYRIVKFQVVGSVLGSANYESVSQIWKIEQTAVTATIDFSDQTLLGIGLWSSDHTSSNYNPEDMTVIFDGEVFNQDIYITQKCGQSGAVNYYIELEQVKLDLNESTVATLKDIRNVTAPAIV